MQTLTFEQTEKVLLHGRFPSGDSHIRSWCFGGPQRWWVKSKRECNRSRRLGSLCKISVQKMQQNILTIAWHLIPSDIIVAESITWHPREVTFLSVDFVCNLCVYSHVYCSHKPSIFQKWQVMEHNGTVIREALNAREDVCFIFIHACFHIQHLFRHFSVKNK